MNAYQILQHLSDERVSEMILFIREEDRDTYRAILMTVAQEKRLRPEFVQKKSRWDQAAWLTAPLRTKKHDQFGEHFLQVWLMKDHTDVLTGFLDDMGIEHDGTGSIEDIPETLDAKKYPAAVENLFSKHDEKVVAIYLHVFNLQHPGGYPEITATIAEDKRAQIAPQAA